MGAGSVVFTRGLVADLLRRHWEADLALVDVDARAMAVADALVRKMLDAAGATGRVTIRATTDRRQVLPDATAVIATIGVGGRRAWEQDVLIPRRRGLFYPVGDTVGPGGTSRALRMIPPTLAIARDVEELCPAALFFNYANPMTPICRAVRKHTRIGVVGLCHGVFHVAKYLAEALDADPSHLRYTAVGVNHLTWFTEIRVDGRDAMPQLRDVADKRLASRCGGQANPADGDPFSWELFRLTGAFPAVLDRHVTEFFPQSFRTGAYYGRKLGVDAFSFEETIASGDRSFTHMEALGLGTKPLPAEFLESLSGEHEQVLDIIEAIRQDRGEIYSANLPNSGQVPNLPAGAIIEAPAVADGAGLRHLAQPPLPAALAGTLATRLMWCETVVEAAVEGSRDKLVQALMLDGCVDSLEAAGQLADELRSAHAQWLPQFAAGGKSPRASG